MGVVEEVDRLYGEERAISAAHIVLAVMSDGLSGRSPLFRLPQAFPKMDTELVLGEATPPDKLNDDAVGRVLDRLHEVGTSRVLDPFRTRLLREVDYSPDASGQ